MGNGLTNSSTHLRWMGRIAVENFLFELSARRQRLRRENTLRNARHRFSNLLMIGLQQSSFFRVKFTQTTFVSFEIINLTSLNLQGLAR